MSDFDWTEYEIPKNSPGLHDIERIRLEGKSGRYQRCCCYFDDDNDGLPVTMCNHHRAVLDELRAVSCENSVLWDTLEHIASMDSEKYILGNATSLAKFAVESRDARVSEGHAYEMTSDEKDIMHKALKASVKVCEPEELPPFEKGERITGKTKPVRKLGLPKRLDK